MTSVLVVASMFDPAVGARLAGLQRFGVDLCHTQQRIASDGKTRYEVWLGKAEVAR